MELKNSFELKKNLINQQLIYKLQLNKKNKKIINIKLKNVKYKYKINNYNNYKKRK